MDRLAVHLSGEIHLCPCPVDTEVHQWMQKVEAWNPKMFTLTLTPAEYRAFVFKFIRRVLIACMPDAPDLASMYHVKLHEAYETEEKVKDLDIMKQSEEELTKLLDGVASQISRTKYLAGDEFSPADSMLVPILVRVTLLDLDDEYINRRPKILEYYNLVKLRPSYKITIGKHFSGVEEVPDSLQDIILPLCSNPVQEVLDSPAAEIAASAPFELTCIVRFG